MFHGLVEHPLWLECVFLYMWELAHLTRGTKSGAHLFGVTCAFLAQLVEHLFRNQRVTGSIPVGGSGATFGLPCN